ncbi:MAG: GTPase Era [Chloroflexi bacterium]|nr:GTPase Era [Chloroflexota bacterium]
MPSLPPDHRSGFVAVVGKPNVGKSTLINAFLGQKIAPVSPRPQTTRARQLGILTRPDAQVVFVDTPGVHSPRHKLGRFMNEVARRALSDADVILFIVDLSAPPDDDDRRLADLIRRRAGQAPTIIALNKVDLTPSPAFNPQSPIPNLQSPIPNLQSPISNLQSLLPDALPFAISATRGDGREALLEAVLAALPPGPRYYPEEDITDAYVRDIAGELVREAGLRELRDEVPHGLAVRVDEFKERPNGDVYVLATVFVEKESHKGIVIGRGGAMLKQIGGQARAEIEALTGSKVFLELKVRVSERWRDDEAALRRFGYVVER